MNIFKHLLFAALITTISGISARAEMRGPGPFVAYVTQADNGAIFLLDGYNPASISSADTEQVAPFVDQTIQFYAAPSQGGSYYEAISNITAISIESNHKNPIISVALHNSSVPFAAPVYFDMTFIRGPQGVYSPDTKYIHAAVWGSSTGVPRIVRHFSIDRAWDAGYDQTDMLKESPFTRSVNVILPPGEYALVLEGVTDDKPRGGWSGGRFLLAAPSYFSIEENNDTNALKSLLLSWLNSGPITERVKAARILVEHGEDKVARDRILDDLQTGVFDDDRCEAISFLSQYPTPDVLNTIRMLILREHNDRGIENILSCIPTDNSLSHRPPAITQLLISMLAESRFVEASHSSLSYVRVSDCIAAWLAATTHGSEYFKNTTVEERDKQFAGIIENAMQKMAEHDTQQSVAGYPPQGVGPPEP